MWIRGKLSNYRAATVVVSVANAKTYDLSDDSTFNSALVSIIDENDGTDTIINKTINPNYTGTRDIYSLVVQKVTWNLPMAVS